MQGACQACHLAFLTMPRQAPLMLQLPTKPHVDTKLICECSDTPINYWVCIISNINFKETPWGLHHPPPILHQVVEATGEKPRNPFQQHFPVFPGQSGYILQQHLGLPGKEAPRRHQVPEPPHLTHFNA